MTSDSSTASRRRRRVISALVGAALVAGGAWVGLDQVRSAVDALLRGVQGEVCTARTEAGHVSLTGEQMGNAATIAAVGRSRGLPARAQQIALATAMQESDLTNLGHGDRDSLGLFQQRPSSGWGTPEQVRDPVTSAGAFYDALIRITGYEQMPLTDAAQAVQRSAYPDAYAQHETDATVLTRALGGELPAAVQCDVDGRSDADPTTVTEALSRELGRSAAETRAGVVDVPSTGTQAWALAHWAVARATALGISTVSHDGRTWTAGTGWRNTPGSPGVVRITVAERR